MKVLLVVAAVLQVSFAGVSVTMPYLNPAGVTYVQPQVEVGHGLTVAHGAVPVAHAALPVAHAALPVAHAAVPVAHQIVAHQEVVPVQPVVPAVLHKEVDVAQPAVKTSRIQIRRPAIQKQFYDVEERTIVRPAGSALVELEQPHAKLQQHAPIIGDVALPHPAPVGVQPIAPLPAQQQGILDDSIVVEARRAQIPQPQQLQQQPQQLQRQLQQQPQQPQFLPQIQQRQQQLQLPIDLQQQLIQQSPRLQTPIELQQQQIIQQQQQQIIQQQQLLDQQQQQLQQPLARQGGPQNLVQLPQQPLAQQPLPQQPLPQQRQALPRIQQAAVLSPRNYLSGEELNVNQQRYLDLLSPASGNVELGFGNGQFRGAGDAGQVVGRVVAAQKAARTSSPVQEQVKTRRIVVPTLTETVQEVDVHEPITKIHRVAVQQQAYAHANYLY